MNVWVLHADSGAGPRGAMAAKVDPYVLPEWQDLLAASGCRESG